MAAFPARVTPAVLLAAALILLAAGCVPSANDLANAAPPPPAGFWLGLWHGIIAPITFVISLFSDGVGMYEVRNNGGWYDLGYLIGFGSLHGGGAAGRRARRRGRQREG
jgi:hypothetical protein